MSHNILTGGFIWLDRFRRDLGTQLDAAGLGPLEAPWREAGRTNGMRLRVYGEPGPGPILLLVPPPIKRVYIWDLAPERSVVRHALAAGFNIGLIEWTEPEGESAASFGLDDYADRLIGAAVDAISDLHGSRSVLLAGYSLGGMLAAIFAALHPGRVRGLLLLETPLRFGPGVVVLGMAAAAAPWGPEALSSALGVVPGSVLSGFGIAADPVEFLLTPEFDALASTADPEALATYLRVVRWTLDEFAMSGRLFEEVVGRLCRDDAFHRGTLALTGRQVAPARLGMPILAVLDPLSRLVPPWSVLPFLKQTGSNWTIRQYREEGADIGFRHLGPVDSAGIATKTGTDS